MKSTQVITVDFRRPVLELDGSAMKEALGANDLRKALLAAGIAPDALAESFRMIAPFIERELETITLTIGRVCANALQAPSKSLSHADAVKRMALAIKCVDDTGPVEISEKDAQLLRECVRKAYDFPIVSFRLDEALSGQEPSIKKPKPAPVPDA